MYQWNYGYTGGMQHFDCPAGQYLIECWGAGGGNDQQPGGQGGYTKGIYTTKVPVRMHVGVGGAGWGGSFTGGGYLGGGKSGVIGSSGGGGGATFVAVGPDRAPAMYEAYKDEILLLAGGGGGGGLHGVGGAGNGGPNDVGYSAGYRFGSGEDRGSYAGTNNTIYGWASYKSQAVAWTKVAMLRITQNGVLTFYSYNNTADTHGRVIRNGAYYEDDDSGDGLNFSVNIKVYKGDSIGLYIAAHSTAHNVSGICQWACSYPAPQVDGGGGGGGFYGGYAAVNDMGGGGGSGYVNSSKITSGQIQRGGGAAAQNHGGVRITLQSIMIYDPLGARQSHEFPYIGWPEGIRLTPGLYKFECWGGAGGGGYGVSAHSHGDSGGCGGYTSCIMKVEAETIVYAFVGGAGYYGGGGSAYGGPTGGWNGGGNGANGSSGSGGGATDFRVSINSNILNSINPFYDYSLKSRFCVAGGGGGSDNGNQYNAWTGDDGSGGSGGGLESQGAWIDGRYDGGYRAGQGFGYALGQGQSAGVNTDTGGAGGGWYGGWCTNHNNGGAGGGSSYIKGYPGCDARYTSYQNSNISYYKDGVMNQFGNYGHGKAKVTRLTCGYRILYRGHCSGDKSYLDIGQVATAKLSYRENEYFISWAITNGYTLINKSQTQAQFKAPIIEDITLTSDITIVITGTKGQYADLKAINCTASMWYIKPNTKIRLTATDEKMIDNYLSNFVNFFIDKGIFTKTQISDNVIDIQTPQLLPYAVHYVEAIYVRKRTNSDIYKPSQDNGADYEFLNEQE